MVFKKKKKEPEAEPQVDWDGDFGVDQKGDPETRTFDTGATRDGDTDKPEYGGFLSIEVLKRFGLYMHLHRFLPDGTKRASDNWTRGIPKSVYLESLLRHVFDVWSLQKSCDKVEITDESFWEEYEDALCACLFNVQGLLYEVLKFRDDQF